MCELVTVKTLSPHSGTLCTSLESLLCNAKAFLRTPQFCFHDKPGRPSSVFWGLPSTNPALEHSVSWNKGALPICPNLQKSQSIGGRVATYLSHQKEGPICTKWHAPLLMNRCKSDIFITKIVVRHCTRLQAPLPIRNTNLQPFSMGRQFQDP